MIRGLVYLAGLATICLAGLVAAVTYKVHTWPWDEYVMEGREFLSDRLDPVTEGSEDSGRAGDGDYRETRTRRYDDAGDNDDGGPPAVPTYRVARARPTPSRHTVRRGDTLYAIARRYYGTATLWPAIARANGIRGASDLRVGDVIVIPALPGEDAEPNAAAPAPGSGPSFRSLRLALSPAVEAEDAAPREEAGP